MTLPVIIPLRKTPPHPISDHEFLPAALEILETPPSPVRMALILIICALFLSALVWGYVGKIDIIATAQGKLQPTGRTKIVQPLEPGKVLKIDAENGRLVKRDDVLIELDASEAAAEEAGLLANLISFRAEASRRTASIAAAPNAMRDDTAPINWDEDIPLSLRQREERVLSADLQDLRSKTRSLLAQTEQKKAEVARLTATIAAQEDLLKTEQARVDMRQTLMDKGAGSKANLLDSVESVKYQTTVLIGQIGQKAEAEANIIVLERETEKIFETFIADNAQKLADAERQVGDLTEKLAKAHAKTSHMTLRSPIDGIVQASTVTTVGQVLTSGEEIMRIVPEDAVLEIECYLPNKDIGFVKEGQEAVIKVESFPFTRYGTLRARVTRVARDAIPEPDANRNESSPTKPMQSTSEAGGQRTQNLVFPVTLKPENAFIRADNVDIPLSAGMAVTAEISTGRRRILEYIFSPIVQIGSESMRER